MTGKSRKTVQVIILLAILMLGVYAIVTVVMGKEGVPKEGDQVPGFKLLGSDGAVHTLDDFDGQAKVINFWGTYCEPCVREMPALQEQWLKWKDQGVEVIGINVGEDKMTVENFAQKMGVEFPVLMDPNRDAVSDFRVGPMPTTFFVDSSGRIHHIRIGQLDLETLDKQIEQLVNGS
ncbi:redoxin domain-containing protein [Paenibacillus lemnae]|uniref:Redoxin domain-containing protein n=1 Tax=Paenibacillus lemnae TaxID=1330551 RepID=A0A848M7G8_PAELE|nr:redoxin domain-containing protein [Paenibacillus lemnae]NMO96937.1 redoxin domain-containing protein [Paenibacillus lemnae]